MNVSIIIPTIFADQDKLNACLEAVEATAPDAECLLIDGGTFAENCNEGAQMASGDVLVFLNDDTIPQLNWLDRMVACLDSAPIVGARLLYPDGRIQHTGVFFSVDEGGLVAWNRTWDCPSGDVPAVTGAALLIWKDVFHRLDGFDVSYRNGYEDVDLCLRARERGFTVWYCAESTIIHHESVSGPARWAHVHENVRLLQDRWVVSDDGTPA